MSKTNIPQEYARIRELRQEFFTLNDLISRWKLTKQQKENLLNSGLLQSVTPREFGYKHRTPLFRAEDVLRLERNWPF